MGVWRQLACLHHPQKYPETVYETSRVRRFSRSWCCGNMGVSEEFLLKVSGLLDIATDRIGIYVGEPNDQQKLVIIDVSGVSSKLVKVAVGKEADVTIKQEAAGMDLAMQDEGWRTFGVSACTALSVCGRSAVVMERVEGRQLTPKGIRNTFFLRISISLVR